jgi:hypothetical protein
MISLSVFTMSALVSEDSSPLPIFMLAVHGKPRRKSHGAKIQTKKSCQIKPESRKCANKERHCVFGLYNFE